jgi:hypothetical protein
MGRAADVKAALLFKISVAYHVVREDRAEGLSHGLKMCCCLEPLCALGVA